MHDVDAKYKPIHRRDITRSHLPILYRKCVSKLQGICARLNFVSLTLDSWTDRRMRSYFGITLHAIIDDKHRSFLLSFERLEGHHTADKLSAEFDRVIQVFNLNNKVVRLITDNASNNLAAFDNLVLPGFDEYFDGISDYARESHSDDSSSDDDDSSNQTNELRTQEVNDSIYYSTLNPPGEDEFLRLPCFCHCLQLVVNDGINASGPALAPLKKVANLTKFAHTSTLFAEQLEKANYTIPKANRTRWNSQFHMVRKVINIPSSTLNSILTDLRKNDLIINSKERRILEEFVSLFELFNEATVLAQGESYTTISLVAPTILGILFDLEREVNSSLILVDLCKTLISSIKARFSGLLRHFEIDVPLDSYSMSERFSDMIFLISPLLDARFKLLWLNNLDTVVKMRVLGKIRAAFVHFYSKLNNSMSRVAEVDVSNATDQGDIGSGEKTSDTFTKRKCLFPYFKQSKKVSVDDKTKILVELDAFLCDESCEENLLFNKKMVYPRLYDLSLKYLTVPATSSAIERVFSQSGFIMRPHRAKLTTKNVCLLTFLKCNKVLL